MKVGKPKSKRTPVRLRHKIEKAASSKRRKDKKLAKKNPQWRSRIKKDPGIPNLFPYRDKILHEIEEARRLKAEEAEKRRQNAREQNASRDSAERVDIEEGLEVGGARDSGMEGEGEVDDEAMDGDNSNPMAALLASARARVADYNGQDNEDDVMDEDEDGEDYSDMDSDGSDPAAQPPSQRKGDTSRRAHDKVFKQVVEAADVVLYVLDARNPEGTRSKEVERMVTAADGGSKRLILILNKIDLVPPSVLQGWLTHLRRYFPAIPFQAMRSGANARTFDHKTLYPRKTAETLFTALKSFAKTKQLKRAVTVGVIGYPNVGKSSVVNALASRMSGRSDVCQTGAEAGVTTGRKEVKLDSKLKLLDSPGIVLPGMHTDHVKGNSKKKKTVVDEERASLILLNAVPTKEIDDPISAVSLLLKRLSEHADEDFYAMLLEVYKIPPLMRDGDDDATTDFLVQVARRRGRLGKGGVPDLTSAAKAVITDWRDGRISGWMAAPKLQVVREGERREGNEMGIEGGGVRVGSAPEGEGEGEGDRVEIVKEWAAEFSLDGLWGNGQDGDGDGERMES